jgi:motility quorum-sensing regulator/GCU-specific mRNA interferase toxin
VFLQHPTVAAVARFRILGLHWLTLWVNLAAMEKRKPHYDLAALKLAVQQRGADAFTATALVGAQAMGLDSANAIDVVCAMTRADFYKSMTTHAASHVWQDVYHCVTPNGKVAYVKVTLRMDGSIVIQFKEK